MGWRCFLAAELPGIGIRSATELIDRLAKKFSRGAIRWVNPDQLHLTLHFLGDEVSRVGADAIAARGREIAEGVSPFTVTLEKLETLPPTGPARVIILPCSDRARRLAQIRNGFLPTIASLRLPQDLRPWRPHVTLGRIKGVPAKLPDLLAPSGDPLLITRLTLYRSILGSDGPQYAKLAEFPLGGR
ncbi:MAG: RNA 2',3'-cyclic phosphodiesterase [bacterium]|nr:RNA 2',3'-cyclic phosphodiesterase [bacterium]